MAARCTTPSAAMHHLRGMGAPWHWCRTGGEGVCFMRSECRTTNGQGVVLARRTHTVSSLLINSIIVYAKAAGKKRDDLGGKNCPDVNRSKRVWDYPQKGKWRFGRQPGAPFFRCVATPDVLANQQVTPVWQAPFFCKCTYTCCACCSLKSQPQPFWSAFFTPTRTLFSLRILTRTPVPDILKSIK